MATEKLLELVIGKGLEAGLTPSVEPTAGQVWSGGSNVWFRDLSVEQVLGRSSILSLSGRPSQFLAQAFNAPNKSLYFESSGIIYQMNGTGNPTVFGAPQIVAGVDGGGNYWLEPWGTWLLITDTVNQPSLWQGSIGTLPVPIGVGQFKTAKIFKKIAQIAVAYNTDVAPNGFAFSNVSDPTPSGWTPVFGNSAGNLAIRDLDSEIIAVADLGAAHAVYSRSTMLLVQYVGPSAGWLGTPNQAISTIGAVSKHSVVSVGAFNFGLSRSGIFATDGTSANWIDRPAVDKFIQENIDWTQSASIWGFWNDKLQVVVWYVPLLASSSYYTAATPRLGLYMDPKTRTVTPESIYLSRKTFGFVDGFPYGGMEREVFDYPIIPAASGLFYESIQGTLNGSFSAQSQLFDAGDPTIYKLWDFAIISGTFDTTDPTMQIAFGHTDSPTLASVVWDAWQPLTFLCPPVAGPRESIYLAFKIQGSSTFKITSIKVMGEKGGSVN
jgi:hypothetical protein